MDINLLKILSCPCQPNNDLCLESKKINGNDIIEGKLKCNFCGRVFPIVNGIPNLLLDDLIKNSLNLDCNKSMPGPREWKADFLSKLISSFSKKNTHDNRLKPNQSCLNIGCGEKPEPGINIDIYLPKIIPENFILASAEYLPFKDNTFDMVISSYVIEHLINPAEFIKKQFDITRWKVIIITDNSEWLGDLWFRLVGHGRIFHDEHCYRWTVEYLKNLLDRLELNSCVFACNLSPSYIVSALSKFGKIPRLGRWFYRDIVAEIVKN